MIFSDFLAPSYTGLRMLIVPSWEHGYTFRYCNPGRRPTKREGRKGTKRAWKKTNPRGLRWRWGRIEPKEVLFTPDRIFCTAAQAAELEQALVSESAYVRELSTVAFKTEVRLKPRDISDALTVDDLLRCSRLMTKRFAEREEAAFRDLYLGKPFLDPEP